MSRQITFVYPNFESLGIEYLIALCLKAGHEVELVSYRAEDAYLGLRQKNISFNKIGLRIVYTDPDLVAFSCVTDNYQYQLCCAKALKKIRPEITTIFGGVHPTAVPKLVLQEPAVDAVAIGEADISFLQFLKNIKKKGDKLILPDKKIKGIVFKKERRLRGEFKEGNLIDLDKLSFPCKEPFFASSEDIGEGYFIITSRGCPFSCSYCFNSVICKLRGKRVIRQRSVVNVIDELLWAKAKYHLKNVVFVDDSFTASKKWLYQFLKVYKRKIDLPFTCIANLEYIDKKTARWLGSAGCVFVEVGIQSLSKELCRNVLNRVISRKKSSPSD